MTPSFQLTFLQVLMFIEGGIALLWLFRRGIPTLLRSVSAFFWGLSCAWDYLWTVYADTLQRTKPVEKVESPK